MMMEKECKLDIKNRECQEKAQHNERGICMGEQENTEENKRTLRRTRREQEATAPSLRNNGWVGENLMEGQGLGSEDDHPISTRPRLGGEGKGVG